MVVEEQAAKFRRGLDATLRSVQELTSDPRCAADLLLHRMNGVLHAAANTNHDETHRAIYSLYESIDQMQQGMVARCEDLPFLNFSRSFAVVFERMAHLRREDTTTVSRSQPYSGAEVSSSVETPTEERLMWEKTEDGEERMCNVERSAAAAAPATDEHLVGSEAWRRAIQLAHPDKILDFSRKAIEGRITIYNIPVCMKELDVRALLRPFGPLVDFLFRHTPAKGVCFALVKLQSNRVANDAVDYLNGLVIDGFPISVKRAMYLSNPPGRLLKLQQPQHAADTTTVSGPLQYAQLSSSGNDQSTKINKERGKEEAMNAAAQLVGTEEWRRAMQLQHPHKKLDFSLEGIEGRIMMHNVPCSVFAWELRVLLKPFGSLLEFYYPPVTGGKTYRYAHAKLESNAAADEAVAQLNGKVLLVDSVLKVQRALYWSESRFPQSRSSLQLQQPRPQFGSWQAKTVADFRPAAAAAECADAVTVEDVDYEWDTVGRKLDSDDSSYFSVD